MGWEAGTPVGNGSFHGLYTILIHHTTPTLDAIHRAEWFSDSKGLRTGFDADYAEVTFGLNWHPIASLEIRPEIRGDFARACYDFEQRGP